MEIKSTKATVNAKRSEVMTFLKDAQNMQYLLPMDKVSDFEATPDQCSFKVQGAIVITLLQNGNTEDQLHLKAGEKSPFPFDLTVHLSDQGMQTEGYIHFNGKVNAFLKMMVDKPLTALFEHMTQSLKQHFDKA